MAALRQALRALVLAALLTPAAAAATVRAADPTPGPASATSRPATCSERFPADGPAGVDLRLGCIVGEVVGVYTAAQAAPPAPLSTYAILVGIVILSALLLAVVAGRFIARRAGRRLAPVLSDEWWVCTTCKSVNGAGVAHCYACGNDRPDGPALVTDNSPTTPQSFGRGKRG